MGHFLLDKFWAEDHIKSLTSKILKRYISGRFAYQIFVRTREAENSGVEKNVFLALYNTASKSKYFFCHHTTFR